MFITFFRLLTELSSRKWLSQGTGAFAKSKFSRLFIKRFAQTYQIHVAEAEHPLTTYESLNHFFTRRLKHGARPVDSTAEAVVSPVDAVITGMGAIHGDRILNVKGQEYSVRELLQDDARAAQFGDGFFFVLYLSPRDYHRIHCPADGTVTGRRHLPGKVYPVNQFGLRHMKRVLSRNERLITYIRANFGGAGGRDVAVVKVGALNVSSIQYVEPQHETLHRGAELAYFEFGSTIVLLLQKDAFQPAEQLELGSTVVMGQALGRYGPMQAGEEGVPAR